MTKLCHMGAAVNLKDHLSFSILTVFSFSLISLVFALVLSWEGKSNASAFLLTSFMLAVLGSILCTKNKSSLSKLIKFFVAVNEK